ncbi:MAG: hypothetical protein IPK04_17315 [Bdellovibrionales bacterium]|nr:hypothetical protein [Bdellovibrionales bacterium]
MSSFLRSLPVFVLIISSFLIETSQASDSDVVAEKKVVCGGFYEGVKTHGPDKSDKVRPYLSDDSNEDSVTYWLKDGVLKDLNKLREHQGKNLSSIVLQEQLLMRNMGDIWTNRRK